MNYVANPHYAKRSKQTPPPNNHRTQDGIFVKLPAAPITASPVPHLTSLYHFDSTDKYGCRKYPGNCGGELIIDLLLFFQPQNVLDPMTGSGTCNDVCMDLDIECTSWDLHEGMDACDASLFPRNEFDFVWLHPPYFRQKLYAFDDRDLSRAPNFDAFLKRFTLVIDNCYKTLKKGGKLAILMGDYHDRDEGFIPLTFWTKYIVLLVGFKQCTTDIIRFGHGASSSKKIYQSSFIPGLHDVCMIFEKVK
jgi:hypothetical protein